jgi:hypothetical protein
MPYRHSRGPRLLLCYVGRGRQNDGRDETKRDDWRDKFMRLEVVTAVNVKDYIRPECDLM